MKKLKIVFASLLLCALAGLPIWAQNQPLLFYAAKQGLSVAASATDIVMIAGFQGGRVIVKRITVSYTQTTAGINDVIVLWRSAADTGGTCAAVTADRTDPQNRKPFATILSCTGNPTVGTLQSNIDSVKLGGMAAATATPNDIYIKNFGPPGVIAGGIVLHGPNQQLAVNLNGVTISGGSFNVTIEWMEDVLP